MRRVVERAIGALPLDERGRRAVGETLADWRFEDGDDATLIRRGWIAVRALASLIRTLCLVTAREVAEVPLDWTLGRLIPLVALGSILLVSRNLWLFDRWLRLHADDRPTAAQLMELGLWSVPIVTSFVLPWASLVSLATTPVRRFVPVLGFVVLAGTVSLALIGWIAPLARVHGLTLELNVQHVTHIPTASGTMTLPALVTLAFAPTPAAPSAALEAIERTCTVFVCPAFIFLGARLRQSTISARWLSALLFPVAVAVSPSARGVQVGLIALAFAISWALGTPRFYRQAPSA